MEDTRFCYTGSIKDNVCQIAMTKVFAIFQNGGRKHDALRKNK